MAEAASAVLTIKGLYLTGKDTYERAQRIRDNFRGNAEPLLEQLKVTVSQLGDYVKLEEDGTLSLTDKDGNYSSVGIAAELLEKRINKAQALVGKILEQSIKRKFKNFFKKADIERKFASLRNELHEASNELRNALQPSEVHEIKESGKF